MIALPSLVVLLLSGCATTPYRLVQPGPISAGTLTVTADGGWNALSGTTLKKNAGVWTRDGELLNRLIVLPDIESGKTLFERTDPKAAIPPFRSDMLPHEIAELVESWLSKAFGEGETLVQSSGLRPATYGDQQGFAFDLELSLSDGPDYRGIAGGFVVDGRLNLVIFLGAEPHYFDRDKEGAARLIASARHVSAT
jgi:hypothetical protein